MLTARAIFERNGLANPVINFDGGTLRSGDTNGEEDWLRNTNGGPTVNMLAGGGTFDANGQANQRINTVLGGTGGVVIADSLGGGGVVFNANNSYAGGTTIQAGARLVVGNGGTVGSLGAGAVSNSGTLAFARSDGLVQSSIAAVAGGLSGSGALEQMGPGTLTLDVANTFGGQTLVSGGALRVTNSGALGSTAGETVAGLNARVELSGGITVSGETLRISGDGGSSGGYKGALQSVSGSNTWAGPVELAYDVAGVTGNRIGANAGSSLTITGTISDVSPSGAAMFVVRSDSTGLVNLAGSGHAWGGDTYIYNGTLRLVADDNNGGSDILPVNRNLVLGYGATLNGTLDLNGVNQKVAGLFIGSGATPASQIITNSGGADSTLTIDSSVDRSFGGTIQDGATHKVSLVKQGSGTQVLDGTNTYTGTTTVEGGTLRIDGSLAVTAVTVQSAGTLSGIGTIGGPTMIGGTHSPGASAGLQTFSGGLTYQSTATLLWELATNSSAGRGTSFDGIDVTGGVLLVDPAVTIDLSFVGAVDFTDEFWTSNQSWLVIDLSGTASGNSTTFSLGSVSLDPGHVDSASYGSFSTRFDTATGDHYLDWTVVPEPSVAWLCLSGLGLAARRRCRIKTTMDRCGKLSCG